MNLDVSLFTFINWVKNPTNMTVDEVISIIKSKNYPIVFGDKILFLDDVTDMIRQASPQDRQTMKFRYLPAVSFNGIYDNGIVQYSNVTALDFDHIPSQEAFSELYSRLMATPCVRSIYRTPSGVGLKAIILHDNVDPSMHGNLYEQLLRMFQTPFTKADSSCRDLSRRNYLCYDGDAWSNPSPVAFHFEYDKSLDPVLHKNSITTPAPKPEPVSTVWYSPVLPGDALSDASIMNILKKRCEMFHPNYFYEGSRRDGVFWFGTQASRAGVDHDYGLNFVKKLYNSDKIKITKGGVFSDKEVEENFNNGYSKGEYDESFRMSFKSKMI